MVFAFAVCSSHIVRGGVDAGILSLVDVWAMRRVSRDCAREVRKYDERVEFPFVERLLLNVEESQRSAVRELVTRGLRDYGCVIAGSAALWTLVEQPHRPTWVPHDIDFVCPRTKGALISLTPVMDVVHEFCLRTNTRIIDEDFIANMPVHPPYRTHWLKLRDNNMFFFEDVPVGTPLTAIDIIITQNSSITPLRHVADNFDLSLCKTCLVWDAALHRVVPWCPSSRDLAEKRMIIHAENAMHDHGVFESRRKKYMRRGFIVDGANSYCDTTV